MAIYPFQDLGKATHKREGALWIEIGDRVSLSDLKQANIDPESDKRFTPDELPGYYRSQVELVI